MNIRFYNARIMTMETPGEIADGEVWISGDRIAYVGPAKSADITFNRETDLCGDLILPGFKNAHTHSPMTFLRSYADDLPLLEWLDKQVFPMEAKLTPDDMYHLAKLAILEYLSSGMTANFDMYFSPTTVAQASIDCGFRTVQCSALNNFYNTPEGSARDYEYANSVHPLISGRLGFHAEYTCSEELLREIQKLAVHYKAPVFCHNSETIAEVAGCQERHGMTPTAYLDSLGMYEFGGGGFHCVHVTTADMKIMRDRKLWAVSNPGSNVKLASGIAPLAKMDKLGIPLALGTDGPASNNCLDMFREMFLATAMQKIKYRDAAAMNAIRVLEMATVGSAGAMGLTECDVLAAGKKADLTVLNLHLPNMQPPNNIAKNIVYSGSKQNIRLTMVDGVVRYEDGRYFVGEDPEAIYKKAAEITGRIKAG